MNKSLNFFILTFFWETNWWPTYSGVKKPAESEYRGRQAEFWLLGGQIQDGVQSNLK